MGIADDTPQKGYYIYAHSCISMAASGANRTSKGYVWGYSPNVDVTLLDK
jgi:hypothetical protein